MTLNIKIISEKKEPLGSIEEINLRIEKISEEFLGSVLANQSLTIIKCKIMTILKEAVCVNLIPEVPDLFLYTFEDNKCIKCGRPLWDYPNNNSQIDFDIGKPARSLICEKCFTDKFNRKLFEMHFERQK